MPVRRTITSVKTFGDRLREARLEAGFTQAKLAQLCGYAGQGAIGNLEKRKTTSARHVAALAKALKVNALWLEKEEGPKRNGSPIAEAIKQEAEIDGFALIERGLNRLVIVGRRKEEILRAVHEAREEAQEYKVAVLEELARKTKGKE